MHANSAREKRDLPRKRYVGLDGLPEPILACQYADLVRPAMTPEERLVLAMLALALGDIGAPGVLRRNGRAPARSSRRDYGADASAWIWDDSESPFSFRWCCMALGLSPESVRARLCAHAR